MPISFVAVQCATKRQVTHKPRQNKNKTGYKKSYASHRSLCAYSFGFFRPPRLDLSTKAIPMEQYLHLVTSIFGGNGENAAKPEVGTVGAVQCCLQNSDSDDRAADDCDGGEGAKDSALTNVDESDSSSIYSVESRADRGFVQDYPQLGNRIPWTPKQVHAPCLWMLQAHSQHKLLHAG